MGKTFKCLTSDLEDSRAMLEQSDRGRKQLELDLADGKEQAQSLTSQNNALAITKRKLENEMQTLSADLDEMLNETKHSEEKAKKAMVDAARLADELRSEQEHVSQIEKFRKQLESTVKELQVRFEDAEATATRTGKQAIAKVEERVKILESELQSESTRHAEAVKNVKKCERRIKELTFQTEED